MTAPYLTKKDFSLLGKIFDAEVNGLLPYQSKSKEYARLEREGLVEAVSNVLPGRFPVVIEGWYLTHAGRHAYCANCSKWEEQ